MNTTTDTLKALTVYTLADMAGVASPDSRESAGGDWLDTIRVSVIEMIHDDETDDDSISERADGLVSVYTHDVFAILTDLALYREDVSELASDSGDVDIESLAKIAQYIAAERLIRALIKHADIDA